MKNLNQIAYELIASCENVNDLEYYLMAAYLIIDDVPKGVILDNDCCKCCSDVAWFVDTYLDDENISFNELYPARY